MTLLAPKTRRNGRGRTKIRSLFLPTCCRHGASTRNRRTPTQSIVVTQRAASLRFVCLALALGLRDKLRDTAFGLRSRALSFSRIHREVIGSVRLQSGYADPVPCVIAPAGIRSLSNLVKVVGIGAIVHNRATAGIRSPGHNRPRIADTHRVRTLGNLQIALSLPTLRCLTGRLTGELANIA